MRKKIQNVRVFIKSILEIICLSEAYLSRRGIHPARRLAEELVAEALDLKRIDLFLSFEKPLEPMELMRCREFLQRRGKGEPLAYISGNVQFFGLALQVSPAVLIPRLETEVMVDKIAASLEKKELEGKVLWDVCCGSGCIGLALKKKFSQLSVFLSDISEAALETAKKNARLNSLDAAFFQGDLLAPFAGRQCHYFVSNPPYVPAEAFPSLPKEVRDFEPAQALLAGPGGFAFYERLSLSLRPFLAPGGSAWMEIGTGQKEKISSLFRRSGWKHMRTEPDWAGHDRFFFLERD